MKQIKGRHLFIALDVAVILAVSFLAYTLPRSLMDYERLCRQTPDPTEKERISLQAIDFLLSQTVPDSIVEKVNQAVAAEDLSLPADTVLFPEIPEIMNDSLAAQFEERLGNYLPGICRRKRESDENVTEQNLLAARRVAKLLDAWASYDYWAPLLNFFEAADEQAWRRWRQAVHAARLSRSATLDSHFESAKALAIYGLRTLSQTPDYRLYLDLCLRLQNPVAEGEAAFNLGFAMGDWIVRECMQARHYLRAVSMQFNYANQLLLLGRFEEAITKLKDVQRETQRWRHIRYMDIYADLAVERMSAASYHLGDYSTMMRYLRLSLEVANSPRRKTLYHLNGGVAAMYRGDFQTAEMEFQAAIRAGQGDESRGIEADPLNAFYAYLDLGELYLAYAMPEKALNYYHQARAYGESFPQLLNRERMSYYWLHCAQAYVGKDDLNSAKTALNEAQKFVDSPYLRVKHLLAAADLQERAGQRSQARSALGEAKDICKNYGMTLLEIDALLRQFNLTLQTPSGASADIFSTQELADLISRLQASQNKRELMRSLALIVETGRRAQRLEQVSHYADLLLQEAESLSRLYDQEKRLIFFEHSIYTEVKAAIRLEIAQGRRDSAFVKSDYIKARALRRRLAGTGSGKQVDTGLPYLKLADLQQRLRLNEAILDYVVTEDTVYAFALSQTDLELFRCAVSRRDLQAEVDQYLKQLTESEQNNAAYDPRRLHQNFLRTIQMSHTLYNQLLVPLAGFLAPYDRLYLVPDEFLYVLPFNTLVVQEGVEPVFLIEQKALMYLPAASFLKDDVATTRGTFPARVLASIDSKMHAAAEIATAITNLFKDNVTMRTEWTSLEEIEEGLVKDFSVYLFYAHAAANWDDPWQSYIQFPLPAPKPNGQLTYADVDSLTWQSADLVVLAGCGTTGNRIYRGAGLSGMQRSFLAGGAKQVLATLWEVDAAHVSPQMAKFLGVWQRSGDAMLALQEMQRSSIEQLKTNAYLKYPHPRFWGAYNLTGTTSLPVAQQQVVQRPRE